MPKILSKKTIESRWYQTKKSSLESLFIFKIKKHPYKKTLRNKECFLFILNYLF